MNIIKWGLNIMEKNKKIGLVLVIILICIIATPFIVYELTTDNIQETNQKIAEENENNEVDEEVANQTKNAYDNIKKIKNETDNIVT